MQEALVAWGKEKSKIWLQILNDHFIGPNNKYLCGNQITIADYFGAAIATPASSSAAISRPIPTSSAGSTTCGGRPS